MEDEEWVEDLLVEELQVGGHRQFQISLSEILLELLEGVPLRGLDPEVRVQLEDVLEKVELDAAKPSEVDIVGIVHESVGEPEDALEKLALDVVFAVRVLEIFSWHDPLEFIMVSDQKMSAILQGAVVEGDFPLQSRVPITEYKPEAESRYI